MNHAQMKLGRKPADHNRPAVRIGRAIAAAIPTHPPVVDNASEITAWGMLGNDQFGDCGPAGTGHSRMQVTKYLTDRPYVATEDDTLAFYKAVVPAFNAATDAHDDGVNLQDMLEVAVKVGFAGIKPVAFAKVDHTSPDEIRAAIAIFGGVLFGVDLQTAQQDQTVWDYDASAEWGGHCVYAVDYNATSTSADISVVTWGELVGTTDAFLAHQLDEAWVVIWPEHLSAKAFLAGVDVATLAADYRAVTGKTFPVAPAPQPAPPPAPVAGADTALAEALRANGFLTARHSGDVARVATAAHIWLAARGL